MTSPTIQEILAWDAAEIEAQLAKADRSPQQPPARSYLTKYYVRWLSDPRINMWITVSLRQALSPLRRHFWQDEGWRDKPITKKAPACKLVQSTDDWIRITPEIVASAAWRLRDRTTKAVARKLYREKWPFLTFHHFESGIIRHHLHIACCKPESMLLHEFEDRFTRAAKHIEWVYNDFKFVQIEPGSLRQVIAYGASAPDNFLASASFAPN
jgi:hypothetical protein